MAKSATKPNMQVKPTNVAEYLHWQIHLCGKSQLDISRELGLTNPNIITMFKQGRSRVPLSRAPALAKAIGVDVKHFLLMCINEYEPELGAIFGEILNQQPLTDNEQEFLEIIRGSGVDNPKLETESQKQELVEFVKTLKGDNRATK